MGDLAAAGAPTIIMAGLALLVLPHLDPDRKWPRLIGAMVVIAMLLRYMVWRIFETLPPAGLTATYIGAILFLAVEMLSCIAGMLLLHVLSRTKNRSAEATANPPEGFPGGAPLIDVLIPTYNEKREILLRTIVGAMAQDYPNFRVWVLDDGRRAWLKEMTEALGAHYATRDENGHGKAGNMNAAIRNLIRRPDRPDVFAILDADFVPTPLFLRRAVALMHDPKVGCVQTPQYFFNPDPIQLNLRAPDIVADEQRFFFDVILSSKDAHGTAFSCGTSALVRRTALEEIGLFPTESVTEDLLLSVKLSGRGWTTAYLNEPLSAGLAPEGMGEYLTQRGRWCLGTMQIVRTPWGPFSKGPTPWLMRFHTMDTVLFWTVGSLVKILGLLVPVLYWWFGLTVMQTDLPGIISHLGPYWVSCVVFLGWVSRGTNVPIMAEAIGLLVAKEALKASWIGLFGSKNQKFKVTAKGTNRDTVVVQWSLIAPYLFLAVATMAGLVWRVLMGPLPGTPPDIEAMNLFWSLYNCLVLFIVCMICVEQPRFRAEERFNADEPATLVAEGGVTWQGRIRDISVVGARVETEAWMPPGSRLKLRASGLQDIPVVVRRATPSALHLAFQASPAEHAALIRKVFSGEYIRPVVRTPPFALVRSLARRALG
jgi:cellulose synthase (UDP-forming)